MNETLSASEAAGRGRCAVAALWLGLAAALLSGCGSEHSEGNEPEVRRYARADRAIVEVPTVTPSDGSEDVPVAWSAEPPAQDSALWRGVALPDVKPGADGRSDGRPVLEVAWYRLNWPGRGTPAGAPRDGPIAVYVPRALGHGLQIWRHDGTGWVPMFDNRLEASEQWNRPLLVNVPPEARAHERGVALAVGMALRSGRNAMSSLWIGPPEALRVRADLRRAMQLRMPEAATLSLAVLGLLSFGVWAGRRREPVYLYFALACLLWSVRNLHYFVDLPRDSDAYLGLWWFTNASMSWVMFAMYQFAFCFHRRRYPRIVHAFAAINIVAMLASLRNGGADDLLVQHAVNILASLFVTGWLSVLAMRGGSRELRVITAALWVSAAFGVHDWLLLSLVISPESIYLLPYASIVMIGSFLYAGMRRFIGAVEQAEIANTLLVTRLDERERELKANHDKLRLIEREQAVLLERQRIMREMHDGVGSTLISTLRVVERGELTSDGVADVLRGAVDDLRMAIDSLEPIEHDLTTLLATLRLRMGRRIEGAGLRLHWDMEDLPPLPWLDAPQAVQVLRLLQEALSNAIQHAKAGTVRISAAVVDGDVKVEVADDGIGVDPLALSRGRGLANMRHRASALGGRLDIAAGKARGTVVRLWLPLTTRLGARHADSDARTVA